MNTPKSDTVRIKLSAIREHCRELLEEQDAPSDAELESPDDIADEEMEPPIRLP